MSAARVVPDRDEDALRQGITEQCIRGEPAASNAVYSAKDFELNFQQRWILQDERYMRTSTEIAGSGNAIYCRSCVEPRKHGKLAAFRLHVTYMDKDPMGVGKHGIIMLECHGCGFEQIVHRKPKVRGGFDANGAFIDEAGKLDVSAYEQMLKAQMAQNRLGKSLLGQPMGVYDPRMAARGIGDKSLSELGEQMHNIREGISNGSIPVDQGRQALEHLMQLAHRHANAAASPPMYGPIKPPKGPFDPP